MSKKKNELESLEHPMMGMVRAILRNTKHLIIRDGSQTYKLSGLKEVKKDKKDNDSDEAFEVIARWELEKDNEEKD